MSPERKESGRICEKAMPAEGTAGTCPGAPPRLASRASTWHERAREGVGGRLAGGRGRPHAEAFGFYSQSLVWFLSGRSEAEEWRDWIGVIKKLTTENRSPGPLARLGFAALPSRGAQARDRLSRDACRSWVSMGRMERLRAKGTGRAVTPELEKSVMTWIQLQSSTQ